MKILLITEFFPTGKDLRFSGGVEARTFFVARGLAKKHDTYVLTSHQSGTKRYEIISGIKVIRVGSSFPYNAGSGKLNVLKLISFIFNAIKAGKKIDPDIVDGGNFLAHLIAKQISSSNKMPLVFWYPDVFFGQWIKTSGLISGVSGYLTEKLNLLRGADIFIAISKTTRKKLIENGTKPKKIKVIPCGVDFNEFKTKVRKNSNKKIICISRLVKYKRIEDLIWAFGFYLKGGQHAELLIIGNGPEEIRLKKLIKMLNLKNHIKFKKNLPRQELVKELKSSHILCLPSEIEGFGISVIEAAAAGVPFIVSDIQVFKEITNNGTGGFLFKKGDIKDLSNSIRLLLENGDVYKKKVREAHLLSKQYDWHKIIDETEKIYYSLI